MTHRIYQPVGSILVFYLILGLSSAETHTYEFSFEVHPVSKCPMSKEAWEQASVRLNCTRKHGYHCVPNKKFTSLIEFCYRSGSRIAFEKGNCLVLADNGGLDYVNCTGFDSGCPDQDSFSNEIYKYPKCLSINTEFNCFDADVPCILSKLLNRNAERTSSPVCNSSAQIYNTSVQVYNTSARFSTTPMSRIEDNCTSYIVHLVVVLSLLIIENLLLCGYVIYKCFIRRKSRKYDDGHTAESVPLNDSIYEEAESPSQEDLAEGEDLFMTLRDVCREGKESEFFPRMDPKSFDENLLNKTDNMGWTLLHHAAYGGKIKIIQHLMCYKCIKLRATDIIGRTVLHISAAATNGEENREIFKAIVEKEKDLLEVEDQNGLMPFCYAALAGNTSILELISEHLIRKQTKYGETVAHLACIGDSLDVLHMLSKMDKNVEKEEQKILPKKNAMGWNPLQYAAKAGNTKIVQFLDEQNVKVFYSTVDFKCSFLTACENGNLEACKYIVDTKKCTSKSKQSLYSQDTLGRHAGHFAAKSGNVEILKYLENQGLQVDGLSSQNINILHMACRHGRLAMCEYIAQKYPNLVTQVTIKGWNAALFLGEKGGADEERIQILEHLVTKHNLFVYHVSIAGKSILYNACANRSYKLCEHLLQTYPALLTIERSMDPRRKASDKKINELFQKYTPTLSKHSGVRG